MRGHICILNRSSILFVKFTCEFVITSSNCGHIGLSFYRILWKVTFLLVKYSCVPWILWPPVMLSTYYSRAELHRCSLMQHHAAYFLCDGGYQFAQQGYGKGGNSLMLYHLLGYHQKQMADGSPLENIAIF